jgi:hypothetical protein
MCQSYHLISQNISGKAVKHDQTHPKLDKPIPGCGNNF